MENYTLSGKFTIGANALLEAKERNQATIDAAIAGDAAAKAKVAEAIKETDDSLLVYNVDAMALELFTKFNDVQEATLWHLKALSITAAKAEKEEYFNTNRSTSGESTCNLTETNKMSNEEVFFITHIAFDTRTAAFSVDEMLRLTKECFLALKIGTANYDQFREKIARIPGISALRPVPIGANSGADNTDDTLWESRGSGWLELPQPIKLPTNTNFNLYVDCVGTTNTALAGNTKVSLKGWHGKRR